MNQSRREWLEITVAAAAGLSLLPDASHAAPADELPPAIAALQSMTGGVQPISLDERRARILRAQKLMAEHGLDALLLASGSSLVYFTGAQWGTSERFFGAVLTRDGYPSWITPAFEKERGLEQIKLGEDVRAWEEHESPYALAASILKDRGVRSGRIGVEETMPFVFADGLAKALPAAK